MFEEYGHTYSISEYAFLACTKICLASLLLAFAWLPDPKPAVTLTPFSCDAPPPSVPLPTSPKMLLPVSGATVSKDLKVIYFDAPPDSNVYLTLEGSNGDYMEGGDLTAVGTVPKGLHAARVSQASVPDGIRRSANPNIWSSDDPLYPALISGVTYRVLFTNKTLRCPKRYFGESGSFSIR